MNKRLLALISVITAAGLLALPLQAQTTAAAYTPTPLDYYKLGQFFQTTTNSMYLIGSSKNALRQKLSDERRELVKVGATQTVLNAYDKMVNIFSGLPFTTAWSTWTPAQQTAYTGSGMDWTVVNAWLPAGDSMPRFYFWLGYDTMFVAKTGPSELNSWGYTLASAQPGYTQPLSDFNAFATSYPNTFKTAIPSVQGAIQALAAYNGKTPPAQADITSTLQVQAQVIYDAANGKISQ
jgi:hypothetical protein